MPQLGHRQFPIVIGDQIAERIDPLDENLSTAELPLVPSRTFFEEHSELASETASLDPDLVLCMLAIIDQRFRKEPDSTEGRRDHAQPLVMHPIRRERGRNVEQRTAHHDSRAGDDISPQQYGQSRLRIQSRTLPRRQSLDFSE